jgi:hypothetical protein
LARNERQVQFPALLISGENKLGSLISAGFAQTALKERPGLQWAHIPGAGITCTMMRLVRFSPP